ncbi:unnamed protein product [Ectocarpus sp. 8 AP-2014]
MKLTSSAADKENVFLPLLSSSWPCTATSYCIYPFSVSGFVAHGKGVGWERGHQWREAFCDLHFLDLLFAFVSSRGVACYKIVARAEIILSGRIFCARVRVIGVLWFCSKPCCLLQQDKSSLAFTRTSQSVDLLPLSVWSCLVI